VKEASIGMPRVPSGFANRKPRANDSTPNSATMPTLPRRAGVSQPAMVTRTGERSAVTARREIGLTMRKRA
jgi:hypothetical protein